MQWLPGQTSIERTSVVAMAGVVVLVVAMAMYGGYWRVHFFFQSYLWGMTMRKGKKTSIEEYLQASLDPNVR